MASDGGAHAGHGHGGFGGGDDGEDDGEDDPQEFFAGGGERRFVLSFLCPISKHLGVRAN